ncbi:MAG: DUF1761 domain-containing protein [Nannocystis sp.]|nr:DUF1761 domain-containing protein [Nannocystis sp.]
MAARLPAPRDRPGRRRAGVRRRLRLRNARGPRPDDVRRPPRGRGRGRSRRPADRAGWVAPALTTTFLFERRPRRLLAIDAGYHVVTFTLMGAILGAWP